MKKIYLLSVILIGLLFSCSQYDEIEEVVENVKEKESPKLKTADGPYRMLGFSYDVTGENLAKESIGGAVIDVDKLAAASKYSVVVNPETGGKNYFYYGYNASDYVKEVSKKTKFDASVSGIAFSALKLTGFGGNISRNTEFDSKYSRSSKYSFASVDITRYVKSLKINEHPDYLTPYLTDKFVRDLNKVPFNADQFVLDYGTHVLTDIVIGGHLRVMYRSAIVEESDYTRKKETIKAGLNGTLSAIGFSASGEKDTEVKESLATKNTQRSLYIDYKAGEGVDGNYDLELEKPTVNKFAWEKSVTEKNAGISQINWEKTYAIYDFIKDPTKKAQVKAAVIRYIKSKQLPEVLDVGVPLFQFSHNKYGYHYNTATWSLGWKNEGVTCYIHPNNAPAPAGAIPLYQYSKDNKLHYNTATYSSGWHRDGIVGYVYKQKLNEFMVPFYQYGNGKNYFHYNTETYSLGWNRDGITCYVYPK